MPDGSYAPTTWEIRFELLKVVPDSPYKLRIATASSHTASIQVGKIAKYSDNNSWLAEKLLFCRVHSSYRWHFGEFVKTWRQIATQVLYQHLVSRNVAIALFW